jgi:hypothetical protein
VSLQRNCCHACRVVTSTISTFSNTPPVVHGRRPFSPHRHLANVPAIPGLLYPAAGRPQSLSPRPPMLMGREGTKTGTSKGRPPGLNLEELRKATIRPDRRECPLFMRIRTNCRSCSITCSVNTIAQLTLTFGDGVSSEISWGLDVDMNALRSLSWTYHRLRRLRIPAAPTPLCAQSDGPAFVSTNMRI